jgi:hypothetical protein
MSSPPASTDEAISSGFSPARAAYMPAVYPAGPEPMMITSRKVLLQIVGGLVELTKTSLSLVLAFQEGADWLD